MSARYDRADVADELRAVDILDAYGHHYRRAGRELRSHVCPRCGEHKREAFSVAERGPFCCFIGGHGGDLIELVALFEGRDCRGDNFQRVLAAAAEIAGVPPRERELTAAERRRRDQERERRRIEAARQRAQEERRRRDEAAEIATPVWDGLRRRNRPGEAYLRERGLAELVGRDDLVRFDERGTVRLPLHDGQGRIVNVPGRYLPGRERGDGHILNLPKCPTAGTFGHPHDLLHQPGDVVLTEGIFDYLSAVALWPERACFGAHGASNLPRVARFIAERIVDQLDRVLWLVPHHDRAGLENAHKATDAAIEAGLHRDRVRALDVSAAGDLNDWLRQGGDDAAA